MTNELEIGCLVCVAALFIIMISGAFLINTEWTVTGKLLDARHIHSDFQDGSTMLIISDPILSYQTVTYERGISGLELTINATYIFHFTQNAFGSTILDLAEVIS
jgi:hypothetical protein